ncbi:MAG: hypothetical protein JST42_13245 [Bacteroidetes bacterium]|nr:hypothetical protein [Bacteroidota bacterium]
MMHRILSIATLLVFASASSHGQSPELSLREFASGQIKKGVRSIGMGGDGATWGNYSLVYRDSGTALLDGGSTGYRNGNKFSFTAVGVTLPALKNGLTLYAIALSQYASNISATVKFPGSGAGPDAVHGDGNNQSVFLKASMPLGHGFSAGMLISYERSQFDAVSDHTVGRYVKYKTGWAPSGGFGVTWQPSQRFLFGFRALFNNDDEQRTDNTGLSSGTNNTQEYRLGMSIGLWKGALADVGGNIRHRYNEIYNVRGTATEPNLGFEQTLWQRHFSFRFGVDETSETAGISLRFSPMAVDIAYVHDLALERVGALFGPHSNSILTTVVVDFGNFRHRRSW